MLPVLNANNWLMNNFDDLFDTSFMPRINATAPAINVIENEKNYTVELAAPGLKKDDFKVNLTDDGYLNIKMEQRNDNNNDDKKAHYLRREFSYAKYEQSLLLPDDVDKSKIDAKMEDGVLRVQLPKLEKAEAKKNNRQITVE